VLVSLCVAPVGSKGKVQARESSEHLTAMGTNLRRAFYIGTR
jgi:hypothetical protein